MTQGRTGQILIVDDDFGSARFQQKRLERRGHGVHICGTPDEARRHIEGQLPDLMLLDHHLPNGRNGLDFHRELQRDGFHVPAILVTGHPDEGLIVEALRGGFRDFVTKSAAFLDYLPDAVERILEQLHIERQFLESENLHRVTLASVSDTVLITDDDGRITYVSPSVRANFGYDVDEVLAMKSIESLVPAKLFDPQDLLTRGEIQNIECEIRDKEGIPQFLLVNVKRAAIHGGSILYSIRSVTEHKKLRLQRDRIFSDSLSLLCICGFDGKFQQLNPAWEAVFGFSVEELLSMPYMSLVHPDDVDAAVSQIAKLSSGGSTVAFELRCRRKDGDYRCVLWNATPFLDSDAFYASGQDITERKAAEAKLTERIRLAQLSADVGLALTGEETIRNLLQHCTEAIVKHLDAAFARIWKLNEVESVLELQASAGLYTHIDGGHSRIGVGQYKIGRIAEERLPHLTNDVRNDSRISDPDWAKREEMVSFAGYPLLLGGRLVGVMAMFARHPLTNETLSAMGSISNQIALGIERKMAEASRKEAHENFRTLVNSIEGIVWEADAKTLQFNFVSKRSERLLGYAPRQWINEADFWIRHLHPDDAGWVPGYCRTASEQLRDHEFEYRMVSADGRTVWLRDLVTVIAENGRPVRLRGVMVDITEKKRTDQRLTAQHAVTEILATCDGLEDASANLLATLGRTFGWLEGELWIIDETKKNIRCVGRWSCLPEGDSGMAPATAELAFRAGEGLPGRVAESGQVVWIPDLQQDPGFIRREAAATSGLNAAVAYPIVLGSERMGVLIFFSRSIHEPDSHQLSTMKSICSQVGQLVERQRTRESLRAAEDRYRQSQKMEAVGLLAGGVAHDFNNLLTVILGFAECAMDEISPADEVHAQVAEIHDAARRAAALTHQLLAFSRRQVLDPIALDLNKLARDAQRLLQRVIGEDIRLDVHLASDLWNVHADPAQIEQIILNLAINARDAMPEGGCLIIETHNVVISDEYAAHYHDVSPGEYVLLVASDTGCGMDAATKERIFEPFFTTKERGRGTGMGLATVYGIVKQSEGHIAVYSEPGHGTTFKIYLPRVADAVGAKAATASKSQLPHGNETILLVEDEDGVRKLAMRILQKHGYTVLEAENGEAALSLASRHPSKIDLLLTDVIMPGMSGGQLAEEFSQRRPGTPVLYMSGYTGDAVAHHGVLNKGVEFLQKPFTHASLVTKVRESLDVRPPVHSQFESPDAHAGRGREP